MKAIELFAGVGGFRLGLERNNIEVIWANEWDKYAADTYDKNFKGKIDRRDITTIPASDIPKHDLICGGFPCQAFSVAGKRKGFDETRGTLFFEIMRIAQHHRTPYLFLENVKGLLSHDGGNTFEVILRTLDELGYDCQWQVLNSKDFGVPQNRERVFIIGHLRTEPRPQVFPIGNADETTNEERPISITIDSNYWEGIDNHGQRTAIVQLNQPKHSNDRVYGDSGLAPTLNTMQGGNRQPFVAMTERRTEESKEIRREMRKQGKDWSPRRGKVLAPRKDNFGNTVTAAQSKEHLLTNGATIRRLTPLECERLQGFPDGWTEGVSDTQRYKMMGNAVTVNVIEAIASRL